MLLTKSLLKPECGGDTKAKSHMTAIIGVAVFLLLGRLSGATRFACMLLCDNCEQYVAALTRRALFENTFSTFLF